MSCLATAFMAVICLVTRDTTTKPLLFHPKGERFRAAQNGAAPPSVGRRARMRAGPTALFRIRISRRLRIPAAHRVSGGEPPLASHGMQNSQRVHDAKPRTAVASRHGQWRGGASREVGSPHGRGGQASRPTATGLHHGVRAVRTEKARNAKPRTAPMARRRDEDIAPYRNGTRGVRAAKARDEGTGRGRGMPSRAPRRGAAARWGHRALPPSRTRCAHERAARARGRTATGREG